MSRPSKRAISSRSAAALSALKRKRTDATGQWEATGSEPEGGADIAVGTDVAESGSASDSEDDELNDAKDFILMQPESGWVDAERTLHGYSKTNVGKMPQSKWYYNKKETEKKKEIAQKTYGTISRYF